MQYIKWQNVKAWWNEGDEWRKINAWMCTIYAWELHKTVKRNGWDSFVRMFRIFLMMSYVDNNHDNNQPQKSLWFVDGYFCQFISKLLNIFKEKYQRTVIIEHWKTEISTFNLLVFWEHSWIFLAEKNWKHY